MSFFRPIHYSKLYRDFKSLEEHAYREVIRYFEKYESEIQGLDFEEYFDLLVVYVTALFEIGEYRKHSLMVDAVIEASIHNNITIYQEEDIFQKMLFRKAASLFHLYEFDRAEHILRELLRMNPDNETAALFLKKCLRAHNPQIRIHARAASIFLLLLATFIIALEVLLVRPFYGMYADVVENARNTTFILACLTILGGDLYLRWLANREVHYFLQEVRQEKIKTDQRYPQ
jgi:tetratricopeptide (TPR) repeat protein